MNSLREIKNKARRHLHAKAQVAALHIRFGASTGTTITCRVHSKFEPVGMSSDMSAYKGEMPTRQTDLIHLVFLRSELVAASVEPKKNDLITISADEAYRLDNAEPSDGITVTWIVSRLSVAQTTGLPLPAV